MRNLVERAKKDYEEDDEEKTLTIVQTRSSVGWEQGRRTAARAEEGGEDRHKTRKDKGCLRG